MKRLVLLRTAALAISLAPLSFSMTPACAATVTIKIDGVKFIPSHMTLKRGDQIVWKNEDLVPHTATGDHQEFDSKMIAPGSSFRFKMKKAGMISYHCLYHPTMKADLEVLKK